MIARDGTGTRAWDEFLRSFKDFVEGGAMVAHAAAHAEVVVEASPDAAFEIFTEEIGLWWRRDTPYWNDRERGSRCVGGPEDVSTDIEVTFEPTEGGTRVRIEQTGFERVPEAERFIAGYDAGWKNVLGWYAGHVDEKGERR